MSNELDKPRQPLDDNRSTQARTIAFAAWPLSVAMRNRKVLYPKEIGYDWPHGYSCIHERNGVMPARFLFCCAVLPAAEIAEGKLAPFGKSNVTLRGSLDNSRIQFATAKTAIRPREYCSSLLNRNH